MPHPTLLKRWVMDELPDSFTQNRKDILLDIGFIPSKEAENDPRTGLGKYLGIMSYHRADDPEINYGLYLDYNFPIEHPTEIPAMDLSHDRFMELKDVIDGSHAPMMHIVYTTFTGESGQLIEHLTVNPNEHDHYHYYRGIFTHHNDWMSMVITHKAKVIGLEQVSLINAWNRRVQYYKGSVVMPDTKLRYNSSMYKGQVRRWTADKVHEGLKEDGSTTIIYYGFLRQRDGCDIIIATKFQTSGDNTSSNPEYWMKVVLMEDVASSFLVPSISIKLDKSEYTALEQVLEHEPITMHMIDYLDTDGQKVHELVFNPWDPRLKSRYFTTTDSKIGTDLDPFDDSENAHQLLAPAMVGGVKSQWLSHLGQYNKEG